MIAAEYHAQRLGCSFDAIAPDVVSAIVAKTLPPNLPKAFLEEMRTTVVPLISQVMNSYQENQRAVRAIEQVIAGWLADPASDGLSRLASIFQEMVERARRERKGRSKKPADTSVGASGAVSSKQGAGNDAPLLDLSDDAVKQLIKTGKARGYVTLDELNAVLPDQKFSPQQIEDTLSILSDLGITVVESEEEEARREGDGRNTSEMRSAPPIRETELERKIPSAREMLEEGARKSRREQFVQLFPDAKIITTEIILEAHKRLPFTLNELEFLAVFFRGSHKLGRDIRAGFYGMPYHQGDLKEWLCSVIS